MLGVVPRVQHFSPFHCSSSQITTVYIERNLYVMNKIISGCGLQLEPQVVKSLKTIKANLLAATMNT